jgi:hypothetical protein
LRKGRAGPAAALFKLAQTHLLPYPATHELLDVRAVLLLIEHWLGKLEKGGGNPHAEYERPSLELLSAPDH